MLRIKKNIFWGGLLLLFSGSLVLILRVPVLCLAVVLVQLSIIVIRAKISFFSLFSILLNFCFFQEYLAFSGIKVYGVLSIEVVPIYFFEMYICVCFFNVIMFIFISTTECLNHESKLLVENVDVGFHLSIALDICAIALTLLIFPSVFDLYRDNRFSNGIIPLTGWSCIPHFFVSVAIANRRSRKFTLFSAVFIILWFLLHGERVDSIGLLVFLIIKSYHQSTKKKATFTRVMIFLFVAGMLFIAIGILRSGSELVNIQQVLRHMLIQPTACDVTHVFNCAVDFVKNGNHFYGITYLSYVINCVPYLNDAYSFQEKIGDFYFSPGGGLFFAEPIANFGILFACFFSWLYVYFFICIIRKATRYRYMIYSVLCIVSFRTAWYGLNYPIVTILYFVPAILIVRRFLLQRNLMGE